MLFEMLCVHTNFQLLLELVILQIALEFHTSPAMSAASEKGSASEPEIPSSQPRSEANAKASAVKAAAKGKAQAKAKGKAAAKASVAKASAAKASPKASPKAKAKGKAEAKGKAQAKGKAAPKGKASAKAKGSPALTVKTEEEVETAQPKPKKSANKLSLKDLNKRLLDAAQEETAVPDSEQEEAEDADGEEDQEGSQTKRDRCKKQKFNTLLSQNKLPKHIVDLWYEEAQHQKNPREFRTRVINELFDRDSKGKLVLRTEAPFFTAFKQTNEERKFTCKETCLPRSVFKGMYFQNSEEALLQAMALGEVEVVKQGGKEFYSFTGLEHSHSLVKSSNQKVVAQEKNRQ
jgi:hypothetical protein